MDWESVRSLTTVLSALCAVVAATVSGLVWRKASSSDLGVKIDDGDAQVKAHADRSIDSIRATVRDVSQSLDDMRDAIARIEVHQTSEEKHVLRPRDLGALNDKIGRVAEELAATRAQSTTENKMLSEQMHILQSLVQQNFQNPNRYHQ